jgi:hypothetical protein
MSATGRPERKYRSAQHEGGPASATGCPKGAHRRAPRDGRPVLLRSALAAALALAATAQAGPVEVYRLGDEFCPRDRPAASRRITGDEAIARARDLLPREFCGPSYYVSGCRFDVEWVYETWRVYALQYKEVGGRDVSSGPAHSYVILDPVGNCIANIPGT